MQLGAVGVLSVAATPAVSKRSQRSEVKVQRLAFGNKANKGSGA